MFVLVVHYCVQLLIEVNCLYKHSLYLFPVLKFFLRIMCQPRPCHSSLSLFLLTLNVKALFAEICAVWLRT